MSRTEKHTLATWSRLEDINSKLTYAGPSSSLASVQNVGIFGDNGGQWQAIGVTSTGLSVNTELPSAELITDDFANPTTTNIMSMNMVYNGTSWDRALGTSTDGMLVNLGNNNDVIEQSGTSILASIDSLNTKAFNIEANTDYGQNLGGGTESGVLRVTIANDTTGILSINDGGGTLTVDNDGIFVTQIDGDALTSLQLIDDPIYTLGTDTYTEATSKANLIGAVRNDAKEPLANTDNEISPLQTDQDGSLYTNPHFEKTSATLYSNQNLSQYQQSATINLGERKNIQIVGSTSSSTAQISLAYLGGSSWYSNGTYADLYYDSSKYNFALTALNIGAESVKVEFLTAANNTYLYYTTW